MRRLLWLFAALLLLPALPAGARQHKDKGRYDKTWKDDRRLRKGPPFCESGAGHPVHGRRWCAEKGYRLGAPRWREQRRWDEVDFRDLRRYASRRTLDRREIRRLLGEPAFRRLERYARQSRVAGEWQGRWDRQGRARELTLFLGDAPLARLIDRDGDARIDRVLLADY